MPSPALFVNGQDLDALGFRITACQGPWDIPVTIESTLAIPGLAGVVRTGALATISPRDITIEATIVKTDGPRTRDDLQMRLDMLHGLLGVGLLELKFVDRLSRLFTARLTKFETTMDGPALTATTGGVSMTLTCDDPMAYDANPLGIGFLLTPRVLPIGNRPSIGVVRIMAPYTNPVVTLRNIGGDPIHSVGLTRVGVTGDYTEIDLGLQKITRFQSSTIGSNDIAAMSSGDIESFVFSPEDGDALTGQGPTIECAGLTGDGNCEVLYFRAWSSS